MAFCELKFFSKALEKNTGMDVILPDGDFTGPLPVFYLLGGLSDDNTVWQRRTSLERYVSGLPLIVVLPNGERGWYTDAKEGYAYETYIVRDCVGFVDKMFQTKATREGRAIGGLSMGGYGATKLALKHPGLFCSANSHSGAVAFGHKSLAQNPDKSPDDYENRFKRESARIFGESPMGGPDDPFALAEQIMQVDAAKRPALLVDCGVDDFLIEDNRDFHAHLNSIGLAHEYREFPGVHTWEYWDEHVREAIAFHANNLGIALMAAK